MRFEILHHSRKSKARVGRYIIPIKTKQQSIVNYVVETPSFIPVATNVAMKSLDFFTSKSQAHSNGFYFSNTYHLIVNNAVDIIDKFGGIHSFISGRQYEYDNEEKFKNESNNTHAMNKAKMFNEESNASITKDITAAYVPFITDSGGFQAFSLRENKIVENSNVKQIIGNRMPDYLGNHVSYRGMMSKGKEKGPQMYDYLHNKSGYDEDESESNRNNNQLNDKKPMLLKVSENDGLIFRSYKDGSIIHLTPESTIQAQKKIGANIILPLDELLSPDATGDEVKASMERSHRWELRSLAEHLLLERKRKPERLSQWIFGIVHGGHDLRLREYSASFIANTPGFNGICVGGSVGRKNSELRSIVDVVMKKVPLDMPRHVLGVADISSILGCMPYGIDTFDSCYPARIARQ